MSYSKETRTARGSNVESSIDSGKLDFLLFVSKRLLVQASEGHGFPPLATPSGRDRINTL